MQNSNKRKIQSPRSLSHPPSLATRIAHVIRRVSIAVMAFCFLLVGGSACLANVGDHALQFETGPIQWYWYLVMTLTSIILIAVMERRWMWNKVIIAATLAAVVSFLVTRENSIEAYWNTAASINALASLLFLFVMFYIYEYGGHCVLASGFAEWVATQPWMQRNFKKKLYCITWLGSAVLDNVAMGKAAKKIAQEYYGSKQIPADVSVNIICASNAGGAWSPVGDTTTIMIALQVLLKMPYWWSIFLVMLALPSAALFQGIMLLFTREGTHEQLPTDPEISRVIPRVDKRQLLPTLAIPGLIAGILSNFLLPEKFATLKEFMPTIGLFLGFVIGVLLAKTDARIKSGHYHIHWHVFREAELAATTLFVLLVVYTMHLLPIGELGTLMHQLPSAGPFTQRDTFMLGVGYVSGVVDNIPLIQYSILLGGFVWHRLAYAGGVGGNMFWIGSSSGVNVSMAENGQTENPVRDWRIWILPGERWGDGAWTWKIGFAFTAGFVFDVMLFSFAFTQVLKLYN